MLIAWAATEIGTRDRPYDKAPLNDTVENREDRGK